MKKKDLKEYDVIIAGGGPAGITAAVAAAENGAHVLIVEEDAYLGGCLTDYYVSIICGAPLSGILREIFAACRARYYVSPSHNCFLPAGWLQAIHEVLGREKNLEIMTGARVSAVKTDGAHIESISVSHEYFTEEIKASVYIDATGSGIFSEMAGAEIMYGRDSKEDFGEEDAEEKRDNVVQDLTWMYISQILSEYKTADLSKLKETSIISGPNGAVPCPRWPPVPGKIYDVRPGVQLHWGCRVSCKDTRDPIELAKSQREALELMKEDLAYLREHGYTVSLAPKIGVRECRRVKGIYVMNEYDIINNKIPDDTIAVGRYGIDIWGKTIEREINVTGYGIPYRALCPLRIDNLILSGKIISGSHIAMSSYRVMPIIGNIGQASGTAAALCAKNKISPSSLDAESIKKALRSSKYPPLLDASALQN